MFSKNKREIFLNFFVQNYDPSLKTGIFFCVFKGNFLSYGFDLLLSDLTF